MIRFGAGDRFGIAFLKHGEERVYPKGSTPVQTWLEFQMVRGKMKGGVHVHRMFLSLRGIACHAMQR